MYSLGTSSQAEGDPWFCPDLPIEFTYPQNRSCHNVIYQFLGHRKRHFLICCRDYLLDIFETYIISRGPYVWKKNMYIYIYLYLCVFLMIDSQFATKKVKQPLFFLWFPERCGNNVDPSPKKWLGWFISTVILISCGYIYIYIYTQLNLI